MGARCTEAGTIGCARAVSEAEVDEAVGLGDGFSNCDGRLANVEHGRVVGKSYS